MIYTTYFAKLKKLPNDIVPICIARRLPPKVDMVCYPNLYPTSDILYKYKNNNFYSEEQYIQNYTELVLNKLNAVETATELFNRTNSVNIALVCYEKSTDFCHRHIVAQWFNDNGIECQEWN